MLIYEILVFKCVISGAGALSLVVLIYIMNSSRRKKEKKKYFSSGERKYLIIDLTCSLSIAKKLEFNKSREQVIAIFYIRFIEQ